MDSDFDRGLDGLNGMISAFDLTSFTCKDIVLLKVNTF